MIIFNRFALFVALISGVVACAIVWLLGAMGSIFFYDREWVVMAPIAIVMDLVLRNAGGRRWFHFEGGGQVFFLPVWVWGIALVLIALPDITTQRGARRCDLATVTVVSVEGREPTLCAEWAQTEIIKDVVPGQHYEYSFASGENSKIVCSCKVK